MLTRKGYIMTTLLPAIICIIGLAYIYYLEFKNPKKERDIFIDITIAVILCVVSLFTMYELHFNFKDISTSLYLVLLVFGIIYIFVVLKHDKEYKIEKNKQEEQQESEETEESDNEEKAE